MRLDAIVVLAILSGFVVAPVRADVGSPEHGPREGYSNGETAERGEAKTREILERDRREKEAREERQREALRAARESHFRMLEKALELGRPQNVDRKELPKFRVDESSTNYLKDCRKRLSDDIKKVSRDRDTLRAKLADLNIVELKVAMEAIDGATFRDAVEAMDRDTFRAALSVVDKVTAKNMEKVR